MKDTSQIEFDFHMVEEQEQKLQEIGTCMQNSVCVEMDDIETEIRMNWCDEPGVHFAQKMEQQRVYLNELMQMVTQAQEEVKKASLKAARIEEQAKLLAEERKNGN